MTAARHWQRWTYDEDALLRLQWGSVDLRHLAKRLARTPEAVRARADTLRLSRGLLRGFISLDEAARRGGYCHESFACAVRWWRARGGEVAMGSLPAVLGSTARGQWRQIDPDDAEIIARAYSESEMPGQAAARLGISAKALTRLAKRAGHDARPMRLMPCEWDEVINQPTKGPRQCPSP